RLIEAIKSSGRGGSGGLVGNVADGHEALLARGFQPDIVTDQCTVDSYRGYVAAGLTPVEMAALVKEEPTEALQRGTETLRRHARARLEFRNRGALVFEYGNTLRMRAADAGVQEALSLESFVTLF